jgi:hypothetical protein
MLLRILELAAGVVIAAMTLRDVFDTVVVPGGSRATLRVARRIVFLCLPVWKAVRGHERGLSSTFAPFTLVLSFVVWMGLLAIGFGLMAHALADQFNPPLPDFPQAIFVVGSGLATVGLSETDATGAARWVVLAAGFCGLAVMTMAVTYLLEVQSSIARRDTGILKLATSAGEPPCAIAMLEKYREIGSLGQLGDVLRDGRDWCATVRQSQVAHPSLIYFRSASTGTGWPASLGALLDLALLIEFWLDLPDLRGLATLLREDGTRMATEIGTLVAIEPREQDASGADAEEALGRLTRAGFALKSGASADMFLRARSDHAGWVASLADHLGRPPAPLIPAHV